MLQGTRSGITVSPSAKRLSVQALVTQLGAIVTHRHAPPSSWGWPCLGVPIENAPYIYMYIYIYIYMYIYIYIEREI